MNKKAHILELLEKSFKAPTMTELECCEQVDEIKITLDMTYGELKLLIAFIKNSR